MKNINIQYLLLTRYNFVFDFAQFKLGIL